MYPVITRKAMPEVTGGEVEIQYRQMGTVVSPNAGINFNIYHNLYGGRTSPNIKTGEKTWMTTTTLAYSPQPYWIWVSDYQISDHPVAYELSIRNKGDSQWILLAHIVVNPYNAEGQAVKVIYNRGTFQNPG
jgi:hypothetical protein